MVKLKDARWWFAFMYVVMWVLCTVTIPTPISISPWTKSLYDAVEAIPPGTLILVSNQYGSPGPTFEPFAIAFMAQAMRKDLRMVVVCPSLIFVAYTDRLLRMTGWFDPANGKVYGTDFVYLGFLHGMESGISELTKDPYLAFTTDYYGNAVPGPNVPIMDDFRSASDIKFVMVIFDYPPDPPMWMRQWRPFGVPIGLAHYSGPDMWLAYYNTGDLVGTSADSDGGAQYETLVGKPGLATALTTVSSTVFMLQIVVIVGANVVYWYGKATKKKEEK